MKKLCILLVTMVTTFSFGQTFYSKNIGSPSAGTLKTASCSLILGTPIAVCEANTDADNNYSVYIPFTGGSTDTYTITPSSGTVHTNSNNPSLLASGNIRISGVTEGTNFSMTVTDSAGNCTLSSSVNSPKCLQNTLPYTENFNYTPGNTLGAEDNWTIYSPLEGDNVLAVAGNLEYPGITSSGNSVSYSGAGAEAFTSFTTTTSGILTCSFLMKITDISNILSTTTSNNVATITDNLKGYMARLYVKKVSNTQYYLGFDKVSSPTSASYGNYSTDSKNLITVGDVVLVVLRLNFATNTLSAWFNPDLTTFYDTPPAAGITVTPAVTILNLSGILLRQGTADTTPTIIIDELRVSATTPSLSVKQNEISGLNVYPNPVKDGILYITSNSSNAKTVEVYDILGKQVVNTKTTNNAVNVSNLKGGSYIVKITEDGKTDTRKLIVE